MRCRGLGITRYTDWEPSKTFAFLLQKKYIYELYKNKHIWVRQGQKSYSEAQRLPLSKAGALIMIWFLQIKSSLLQCDKTENINVTRGFNVEVITAHLFKFCYQLLLRWDCLISKHKTKDRVSPCMTSASADSSGLGLEGYLWHRFNKMLDQKIWSIFITQQIC